MAMRSVIGKLKAIPRRVGLTSAHRKKPMTPESLMDEEVRRIIRPMLEQMREHSEQQYRAYRRKEWLVGAAGYGILGYFLTSVIRSAAKN